MVFTPVVPVDAKIITSPSLPVPGGPATGFVMVSVMVLCSSTSPFAHAMLVFVV